MPTVTHKDTYKQAKERRQKVSMARERNKVK